MNAFRACGMPAWVVLGLAILGFTVAALALTMALGGKGPKRTSLLLAGTAIALGIGCAIVGVLGRAWGVQQLEAALSSGAVNPSVVAEIRDEGMREASQCIYVGGFGATPALLLGFVAVLLATLFRKSGGTEDP